MAAAALALIGALALPLSSGAQQAGAKCSAAEHRQLDFWLGEWQVQDAQGKPLGTSRIESLLGGCVLQENWTSAQGSSGKSFILYTPADGKWHYTWVDDKANLLSLSGGSSDGKMVLTGETATPGQPAALNRLSWEPVAQGRVRQLYERSTDGGKTWSVAFDGVYSKK